MHTRPNARLTPLSRKRLLAPTHCSMVSPSRALLTRLGSACAPPTSGSPGSTAAFTPPLRIDGATATCRGPPAPALHPQEDRQGRGSSPLHGRTGHEGPGARAAAEPGIQAPGAAAPVGKAGRHYPCRYQTAGPVRASRPTHHRRPPSRHLEGTGYDRVHVAVDDATSLAYVEVLPDEQKATTVGFLAHAVGRFSPQGITCRRVRSDNGSAYRSGTGARPAGHSISGRSVPIRIRPAPTARLSGSS